MITKRFDFKIRVVQPALTKGMASQSRDRLSLSGDFVFIKPKSISGPIVSLPPQLEATSKETSDTTKKELVQLINDFTVYAKIIDKRCKHITVKYNPNKKNDESITEACGAVFGSATGEITYAMYVNAIKHLNKVDKFLAHRSIINQGAP